MINWKPFFTFLLANGRARWADKCTAIGRRRTGQREGEGHRHVRYKKKGTKEGWHCATRIAHFMHRWVCNCLPNCRLQGIAKGEDRFPIVPFTLAAVPFSFFFCFCETFLLALSLAQTVGFGWLLTRWQWPDHLSCLSMASVPWSGFFGDWVAMLDGTCAI